MYVHTCIACTGEDSLKHLSGKFRVASVCLSSKRRIQLACIKYCTAVPKSGLKQSSLDISALCWDLYLNFWIAYLCLHQILYVCSGATLLLP